MAAPNNYAALLSEFAATPVTDLEKMVERQAK